MDFLTLALANWVLLASNGAVLYVLARRTPRLKGVTWFARGLALASLGIALKLLNPVLPLAVAVLGSSALVLTAFILLRRGLVELTRGGHLRWLPLDLLILAAQTLGLAYFTYVRLDYGSRFVVLGVAVSLECLLGMAELWWTPASSSVSKLPTLAVVGAYLVFNLARSGAAALYLHRPGGLYWVESIAAATQLLFSTLFALGSVWLAITERYKHLSEQILQDSLTGLLNRRALRQALTRAIERSRHGGEPLALLALDLDHFKLVNDTRGHSAGDAALCAVARTLSAAVRAHDVVARLGGEEFIVLLPGLNQSAAMLGAERLRRAVAALRFSFEGEPIPLTASFGVAVFDGGRDPGETAGDYLLRQADLALYVAKRAGRNCSASADQIPADVVRGHSDRWQQLPGDQG